MRRRRRVQPPPDRCWTSPGQGGMNRATSPGLNRVGGMRTFLVRFFTWWNGQTFGTQLWTWLYGELVGEDEFGNRYFRTKGGKIDRTLGFERRWVIYNGDSRGLDGAAVMARLAASHRRRAADRGEGRAAAMVEAASAQPYRHARGASADRLDARPGAAPKSDRRLQGLDAGAIESSGAGRPKWLAGRVKIVRFRRAFPGTDHAFTVLRFAVFPVLIGRRDRRDGASFA